MLAPELFDSGLLTHELIASAGLCGTSKSKSTNIEALCSEISVSQSEKSDNDEEDDDDEEDDAHDDRIRRVARDDRVGESRARRLVEYRHFKTRPALSNLAPVHFDALEIFSFLMTTLQPVFNFRSFLALDFLPRLSFSSLR